MQLTHAQRTTLIAFLPSFGCVFCIAKSVNNGSLLIEMCFWGERAGNAARWMLILPLSDVDLATFQFQWDSPFYRWVRCCSDIFNSNACSSSSLFHRLWRNCAFVALLCYSLRSLSEKFSFFSNNGLLDPHRRDAVVSFRNNRRIVWFFFTESFLRIFWREQKIYVRVFFQSVLKFRSKSADLRWTSCSLRQNDE